MTRLALVITIIIALFPPPSFGQWVSGVDLFGWCEPTMGSLDRSFTTDETLMIGLCAGYVQGWLDWNRYYGNSPYKGENERYYLCVPRETEVQTVIQIVTGYLLENPTAKDFGAGSAMLMALEDFACESEAEEE